MSSHFESHSLTLERLQSLYELTRRINSVDNLDELLRFILERTLALTRGQQGLILLNDKYEHKLKYVAQSQQWVSQPISLDEVLKLVSTSVIKNVLKHGQARLIADLQTEAFLALAPSHETINYKKVRSVLAVPLKVRDQVVGLIYIDHPEAAKLGPSELEFLTAFASQAAFAIHHARRDQTQIEELTLLNELSRSIVQVLDLNEVLTRIVYEATRILHVENGSVLLLDEATSELVFATSVANGQHVQIPTRLQPNQGIAGWVVSQGQPVSINDTNRDERWFGEVADGFETHSLLCVPLKYQDRILGALQVLNKKGPYGFDESDTALLSAFAASATIAIENARMFQAARQAHHLQTLHEATLALTSTLNLADILAVGLEKTLTMLESPQGVMVLAKSQTEMSSYFSETNHASTLITGPFTPTQLDVIQELARRMLDENNDNVLFIDAAHPTPLIPAEAWQRAELSALAIAPIEVGGQMSGTLAVVRTRPYTPDEMSLLESMGRIIGLAIQNAIHYDTVRTQALHLSYLNEVGTALTRSLDTTQVLKVILEGVDTLLENENIFILLIDAQTNKPVLSYGSKITLYAHLPVFQRQIANLVLKNNQPLLLEPKTAKSSDLWRLVVEAGHEDTAILCVPLKIEETVMGVVQVLGRKQGHIFNNKDQTLLIELTRWAAIALQNARLFDERVRAYQTLATEQQRRIAAETRAAMATIILDMTHTMNNVVGAIRVWATRLEQVAATNSEVTLAHFRKELTQIRQNAEEAIKLIGKITAPLDIPEIIPTDINQCLAQAIQTCWQPENIELRTDYDPQLPLARANATRLETVFHNLITNAYQALTPQGGVVTVTTRVGMKNRVEVIIHDNGPGIAPELQHKMFNPGISGKDGGLGIGLWLVDTFIRQFEGQIDFKSTPGHTTFTICLQPS